MENVTTAPVFEGFNYAGFVRDFYRDSFLAEIFNTRMNAELECEWYATNEGDNFGSAHNAFFSNPDVVANYLVTLPVDEANEIFSSMVGSFGDKLDDDVKMKLWIEHGIGVLWVDGMVDEVCFIDFASYLALNA